MVASTSSFSSARKRPGHVINKGVHIPTFKIALSQKAGILLYMHVSGADPEKRKGGGGELRLDWDRSYLVPMKYYLRFKEENLCLLGVELALQLLVAERAPVYHCQ